ncbi:RNA polymerase II transcription elongation factor-domain-containing protein [Trametes punicea]|nr:RNA polymerase II transcription elongation factor-domain-containing protein [Trametes punicea]
MTSTVSNAWMPSGRHEINIGSSLMRALKARKGGPVKNSKAKPDREFYSFRYNFKPESVDPTKPGSIEVKKPKDEAGLTSVNVVRPSTQNDHGVNYVGHEKAAREYDCVLIYDEELGTFTLEKIESCVTLHHDPRTIHAPRRANSPAPAPPPRIPQSNSQVTREQAAIARREEEEESEGEIPEPPKAKAPSRQPAPTAAPPPKAKPPASSNQPTSSSQSSSRGLPRNPASKPTEAVPAKPKPRLVAASDASSAKGAKKRELPLDPEEETLEQHRSAQLKKQKVSPEKEKDKEMDEAGALALPGSGSGSALALPLSSSAAGSAPSALSLPSSSSTVSLPPVPEPVVPTITDSDEEEWDEVQPTIAPPPQTAHPPDALPPRKIVMEEIEPSAFTPPSRVGADGDEVEEEEIDMAAFEEELKEQLGGPEAEGEADAEGEPEPEGEGEEDEVDFLAGAMSPVVERQPVSLSRFVGGGAEFGDDDDYSSSDESDEE